MQAGAKRLVKRLLFALLVLTVGLYLLLPTLVSFSAQEWLRDQGFTEVRLADVDFEPFGGELRLHGLQAQHPSGEQLVLQNAYTNVNWWALAKHRLHLQGVALQGLKLSLERGADGKLTLSGLVLPAGEPAQQDSGQPWGIGIDRLSIIDSELQLRLPDLQRTFRLDDLLITGVRSWNSAQSTKLNLTLEADGTRVVVTGNALPFADERTGSTHIRVESLDLGRLASELRDHLPENQQVHSGSLQLDVHLDARLVGGQIALRKHGALQLDKLQITSDGQPQAIEKLSWEGELDWSSQGALTMVGALRLTGLDLAQQDQQLSLDQLGWNGRIGWSGTGGVDTEGELELTGTEAAIQGRQLLMQTLAWSGRAGWSEATGPTAQGGLRGMGLEANQPAQQLLLARIKELQIPSIALTEGLKLQLDSAALQEPELLHAAQPENSKPLFRAAQVTLGQSEIAMDDHISLGQVAIRQADFSIVLTEDGKLRSLSLLDAGSGAVEASDGAASSSAPARLSLAGVRLDEPGRLSFTDLSVAPPLRQTMDITRLEIGAVDSGDHKKWTPVQFAGAVGEYSRISADGKVRPFSDKLNLELKSTLKGLDMQRLSAYTAGKLGQNVRSGQLDSDIDLKITEDQLAGHAKIVARQLTLKPAEQRESSELNQELGMPVDSALDMLRDSDDNIRLELPISGDIRNPDFDLSAEINQAIGKAMRDAALNYAVYALQPYGTVIGVIRLAGKAGKAANRLALAPIDFDPGSATLRADSEPYLAKLSTMLKERPQLQIQICGLATEGDRQVLQASQAAPKESSDGKPAQLPAIPDETLLQLAEARAAAVKRQLVDRGSAPERLFVCQPEIDRSAEAKTSVQLLL